MVLEGARSFCDVCLHGRLLSLATARYFVHGGCIVLPEFEVQDLCEQHWCSCEPLGPQGAYVLEEYANGVG
jgi:hypothetical protein